MPDPSPVPPCFATPANSILGLIGNTPMVRIQRLCPNPKVTSLGKGLLLSMYGLGPRDLGRKLIESLH